MNKEKIIMTKEDEALKAEYFDKKGQLIRICKLSIKEGVDIFHILKDFIKKYLFN